VFRRQRIRDGDLAMAMAGWVLAIDDQETLAAQLTPLAAKGLGRAGPI
jgi:hypothetical protein